VSSDPGGCWSMFRNLRPGFRPVATDRSDRFLGKVQERTARCRGGDTAVEGRELPWVDWQRYWGVGDMMSRSPSIFRSFPLVGADSRGIMGALLDLEYQRIELLKFNLFDNSGTYEEYRQKNGPARKIWKAMRLAPTDPNYSAVGGDSESQLCSGDLIRHRNVNGICNDIRNPAMGSTGMLFARNVEFESTFPDLGKNELARNRHGNRIDLQTPDPQLISRELFTRPSAADRKCKVDFTRDVYPNELQPPDTNCDYAKAPFFNVLAAFWIQFMTHDWFSHLDNGQNDASQTMQLGALRPDEIIDRSLYGDRSDPAQFASDGRQYLARAYRTTRNMNTAWWDASQIYGYDETSRKRVKRDPKDRARLAMPNGYLPVLGPGDPMRPEWRGQESVAFPDNWSIGMSFFHNVFAREHNAFVDEFRRQAALTPDADSGLRNPSSADAVIRYRDVSDVELFEAARLVVAAEIAKIHTIEWTPQLLYDEPLFRAMNANWNGLFAHNASMKFVMHEIVKKLGRSPDARDATHWYSVFASGAGIFGQGSHHKEGFLFWKRDVWSLKNPDHVNGGVNHFGSPFNFPEEFVTVYRLHALVPDLIDFRDYRDPNRIEGEIAVASTIQANATTSMENRGLANWALSFGRQRLGTLTLGNEPRFLQKLPMPRMGEGKTIDVFALDLIRDREHGVPRFNEFRRQYGLRQFTSFDELTGEHEMAAKLRRIYGQHKCDASKVISTAQRNADGTLVNDCLGHPDGSTVDNIEDVDTVVGWHAEGKRPHGFAISETQFQVFILNASRRLFSDRFFTSSFRPEFYTTLGVEWVRNSGPAKMYEPKPQNGHRVEVSPLKRVLMRTIPELRPELAHVANAFDPWARDRGEYYSIAWKPRPGAESDPAFSDRERAAP
jgi:hypothetical protein